MSLVAGAAAAFIVALVPLAAVAYAQEPPKGGPQAPPSLWHLGLNADAMWYQNGTFTSSAADSTWSTGGRAGLDYTRRFRTGTFGVGGWAGTIYYPEAKDLRQPTYGGSLALSVAPSPRTQFTLAQSVARTNTRLIEYTTGDVPLPTTGVYYLTSSAGLSHSLSQSWQASVSSSFGWRQYDNRSLVDGRHLGVGVQLGHSLGRSGSVFTSYEFMNNWYTDAQSQAHQVLLGGRYQPKQRPLVRDRRRRGIPPAGRSLVPGGQCPHQRQRSPHQHDTDVPARLRADCTATGARRWATSSALRRGGRQSSASASARGTRTRTGGTRWTPSTRSVRRS